MTSLVGNSGEGWRITPGWSGIRKLSRRGILDDIPQIVQWPGVLTRPRPMDEPASPPLIIGTVWSTVRRSHNRSFRSAVFPRTAGGSLNATTMASILF